MTRAPAGNSRGWIPWKGREKAGMDCRRGSRAGKCRESRICISVQDLHLSAGSLTSASALPRWPFPCLLRSFVGRMVASGMSSSFASFSELLCCLPRHGWEGVEQAFLSFWSRGCLWGECVTGMETNQDSRAAPLALHRDGLGDEEVGMGNHRPTEVGKDLSDHRVQPLSTLPAPRVGGEMGFSQLKGCGKELGTWDAAGLWHWRCSQEFCCS